MLFYLFILLGIFGLKTSISAHEIFQKLFLKHPQTQAIQAEISSKYYEAEHEGVYPDPKISFAFRNYPYTGNLELKDNRPDTPGMTGIEYGISQEILYPSRLPKAKQLKFLEYRLAQIQYEIETNTLSAEVFKSIIEYKSAENIIKILESYSKLLESIQKTSNAEYVVGKKQLGSISKTHIEKLNIQESILEWNSKKLSNLSKLKYFSIEPEIQEKDFLNLSYIAILDDLEKELEKSNTLDEIPILKQAQLILKKSQIKKELGEIEHFPDAEVFLSYMKRKRPEYMLSNGRISTLKGNWEIMDYNEFRGDLFSFGVNLKVPVWSLSKIKDLNQSNEFNKKKAELELQKLTRLVKSQVQAQRIELETLHKQIHFMEKEHLQSLLQNLSSYKSNYQTGKVSFVEVLLTQAEIFNLKVQIENLKARRLTVLVSLLETLGIYSKKFL